MNINFNEIIEMVKKLNNSYTVEEKGGYLEFFTNGIDFVITNNSVPIFDTTKESMINPISEELYTPDFFEALIFARVI